MKRLVLLGGGHSHVEVLRQFGNAPMSGVALTLISPVRYANYSGMLPGLLAGHYQFQDCHIDLAALARYAKAELIATKATGLDLAKQAVSCEKGQTLPFEVLSIDIGSAPNRNIPGARQFAVAVKPVESLLRSWQEILSTFSTKHGGSLAIVGGGAGGVESVLAMQYRVKHTMGKAGDNVSFHLVTDADEILPSFPKPVRRVFTQVLDARKINLHLNSEVIGVEKGQLLRRDNPPLLVDFIIFTTTASAAPWLRESGLTTDEQGFVLVNEALQSLSHPKIFAAGDVASQLDRPHPKSGVFTVKQAPVLTHNLRAALSGDDLRTYIPQAKSLALISTGDRYAIATRGNWMLKGGWVWHWKDWIDRRFVEKYRVQ